MPQENIDRSKEQFLLIIMGVLGVVLLVVSTTYLILAQRAKAKQPAEKILGFNIQKHLTPTPVITINSSPISLIFTGDVIPARSVNATMIRKNNFLYPFEKTADFLNEADLTIINLEAPLIVNCPVTDTGMVFCGNQRFIEGLNFAGVDLATLTNNHSTNYGQEGINQTIELLRNNKIETTGTGNVVYKEIKGIKFAFLSFNGVSPLSSEIENINKDAIVKKVQEARNNSDYIIVMFHWGKEYSPEPLSDSGIAPFDPVEIGRFTIDSGADLVVGNHPHVVQGYEIYRSKPIFYALGNFIFDQMWSTETRLGAVLKINLSGKNLLSFTLHPIKIDDYSQPHFLEGAEKDLVLSRMPKYND